MIPRWLLLTLFAVVFAPGLLHAQQANPNAQTQRVQLEARLTVIDALAVQNEKMYEDIEILRRILDRKLTSLYPSVPSKGARTDPFSYGTLTGTLDGAATGTFLSRPDIVYEIDGKIIRNSPQGLLLFEADNPYPATIPFRSLEGVYIKGQGVVYTATLSSLQPPAKAEAHSSDKVRYDVVLQVSEWDSIRRQVRNEKEKPKKPEASKPPSLSDVLLKVLAENGHHFSQLSENESLTIVLTVHEAERQLPARKTTGKASAESAKSGSQEAKSTAASEISDLELLGDLHQKQGHYEEALKAFGKAFSREQHGPGTEEARRLYRKMAQCYLALGNDEDARKMLNSFSTNQKEIADAKGKSTSAAKPAAALPIKLIISAPKKLLDQVKEGKISFEDFRRQASVETLRFGDRHSHE